MDELQKSKAIADFINTFIEDYFKILINIDQRRTNGSVLIPKNFKGELKNELKSFFPLAKAEMQKAVTIDPSKQPKNIYELAGANKLSGANNVTRNISTTLGLLWEKVAQISPYSINPEIEFGGLKLVGIDLISKDKNSNKIEYQQLKTKRDTLTGSQRPRTISELNCYQNPVFCACFGLSKWNFKSPNIPRVAGTDFWSKIGIDYAIFETYTVILFKLLDREFSRL